MLHLIEIGEIKTRAEAINLSLKALAKAAGVDPSTVYKAARGDGDTRGKTLRKLGDRLEAAELSVALSLLELPHVQQALADRAGAEPSEKAA